MASSYPHNAHLPRCSFIRLFFLCVGRSRGVQMTRPELFVISIRRTRAVVSLQGASLDTRARKMAESKGFSSRPPRAWRTHERRRRSDTTAPPPLSSPSFSFLSLLLILHRRLSSSAMHAPRPASSPHPSHRSTPTCRRTITAALTTRMEEVMMAAEKRTMSVDNDE